MPKKVVGVEVDVKFYVYKTKNDKYSVNNNIIQHYLIIIDI